MRTLSALWRIGIAGSLQHSAPAMLGTITLHPEQLFRSNCTCNAIWTNNMCLVSTNRETTHARQRQPRPWQTHSSVPRPHFFLDDFFFRDAVFFRVAFFFPDFGHPFCIWLYDALLTVERDFGRLLPARLRRLMFATSEFLRLLAMQPSESELMTTAAVTAAASPWFACRYKSRIPQPRVLPQRALV